MSETTTNAGDAGATAAAPAVDAGAAKAVTDAATTDAQPTLLGGQAKPEGQGDAAKTEGEGEKSGAKDGEGDQAAPAVPETYEFKMPEGFQLDEAIATEATAAFKELNLTQEQADKLVPLAAKMAEINQLKAVEAWTKQVDDWGNAAKSDKEYGGDQLNASIEKAQRALAQFGSPALTKFLNESGFGNHPELIRAFVRIEKATAEDKPAEADKSAGGKRSTADVFYGG